MRMNWAVGFRLPPKNYREIPKPAGGFWEPVFRLGGDSRFSSVDGGMGGGTDNDFSSVNIACMSKAVELRRAPGLTRCRFSHDGSLVAAADVEGGFAVYDTVTGRRLVDIPRAHEKGINDLSWYGPSRKYILTASSDRCVKLFSLDCATPYMQPRCRGAPTEGRPRRRKDLVGCGLLTFFEAHEHCVLCLATCHGQSSGGAVVYSGGYDERLKVWDLRQPRSALKQLKAHNGPVSSVEISGDDRVCCTSSFDGFVRLWDSQSLHILRTVVGKDMRACLHATFSPNDRYLLCVTAEEAARIWHVCPKDRLLQEEDRGGPSVLRPAAGATASLGVPASPACGGDISYATSAEEALPTSGAPDAALEQQKGTPSSKTQQLNELYEQTDRMGYWSYEYEYINLLPYDRCNVTQEKRKGGGQGSANGGDGKEKPENGASVGFEKSWTEAVFQTERLMAKRFREKTFRRKYFADVESAAQRRRRLKTWGAGDEDEETARQARSNSGSDEVIASVQADAARGESTQHEEGRASYGSSDERRRAQRGNVSDDPLSGAAAACSRERESCQREEPGDGFSGPCSYGCFWRDRAVVGCRDGCLHLWDAYTGAHEYRLPKWHLFDSTISSVEAHPDPNVGVLCSTATEPDSSAILWMFVARQDVDDLGLTNLVIDD